MTSALNAMGTPRRRRAYSQIEPQNGLATEDAEAQGNLAFVSVRRMVANGQPRPRPRAHDHLGRAPAVEHVRLRGAEVAHHPRELCGLEPVQLGASVVVDGEEDQLAPVATPPDRRAGRQLLGALAPQARARDALAD